MNPWSETTRGLTPPLAELVPKITDFGLAAIKPRTKNDRDRQGMELRATWLRNKRGAMSGPSDQRWIFTRWGHFVRAVDRPPPFEEATPARHYAPAVRGALVAGPLAAKLPRDLETIVSSAGERAAQALRSALDLAEDCAATRRGAIRARCYDRAGMAVVSAPAGGGGLLAVSAALAWR